MTAFCAALLGVIFFTCQAKEGAWGGKEISLKLSNKVFPVRFYEPEKSCRALILFGSGDGSWKAFEDKICRNFAAQGYAVAGWDCRKYADAGLYDQKTLATDFAIVLVEARSVLELKTDLPVVFAGYSTGAEQVVAAAAFIRRPSRLDGLLLIAPGERGRYGLTTSDLMGITPRGKGTFALGDFAAAMTGLRIVQIHGEHDPLDSTEWLALLKVPHELKVFPNGWHFFGGGPPEFLKMLDDAIDWIIAPAGNG